MSDQSNTLQRRDVLKGLAASVGATVAVAATTRSSIASAATTADTMHETTAQATVVPDSVEVRPARALPPIFQSLLGMQVGRWQVADVNALQGSFAVVMSTAAGDRFQVDVLRLDETAPGVGNTAHMGVYLSNQGDGGKPSHEEHGLGAMALADTLAVLEQNHEVPALLTMRERSFRFPRAAFMKV